MGIGTFVRETSPQDRPRAGGFDMPLLVIVVALIVFGLVMLYSASWDFSRAAYNGDAMYMFNRQLMWLGLGTVAALILAFIDYHRWRQFIVPAMAFTVLMLIIVLVMSEVRFNATRTIFNGSIQPSELAKLVSILYLAVWLYAKREMLKDITFGLIPLGVILGFVGGLIYLQPDLSAAATVLMLGGLLFFLAGGDLKQIGGLLIIAFAVAWLVVSISLTGQQRVSDFVAGIKDPLQASYHVRRSFEAIVNGGWFGVGIGKSLSKVTGLPVPPTDSIYAVVVEELGWFGGVGLIGLFGALVWRGLVIARRAPDMLGTLLASGLVIWIGLEALINMAVMVGLLPFAGNALPFVSAGGSNLVTTLAALGILFNISRQGSSANETNDEWRSYSAVANLRWWNGRGRVSRSVRLRSAKE
ncbi:MAG TPA: putative peptidoglycan glycosyltransferase FtsW [Anaerolineales bacterium]|nr:putative peptidoglycan glycosyltransferase FtsW [Anaerolineales bacterium]HND49914.1 putative peptidoglycan glycosyltransferase FtsW [Anaerolineales bacterium]HNE03238.1 putative peptidoglycan glycosyltransferase FtsW [Anaerolineales bacterium]